MPLYEILCSGEAREVYRVVAANPREATFKWYNSEAGDPILTEVVSADIDSVREVKDE